MCAEGSMPQDHPAKAVHELRTNVRRARELVERLGFTDTHPDKYMPQSAAQKDDWDDLLKRLD